MIDLAGEADTLNAIDPEYVDPGELDRYRRIFSVQVEGYRAIDGVTGERPALPGRREFSRGVPLLRNHDLSVDDSWAMGMMHSMGELMFGISDSRETFAGAMGDVFHAMDIPLTRVLVGSVFNRHRESIDDFARRLDLEPADCRLWVRESVRPWFWKLAEMQTEPVPYAEWSHGYCPICGCRPVMGLLKGEEGFRHLVCGLCGFSWRTHRLRCGICGNEDEKKLRYIFTEADSPYRADVCDVCKTYVRTIDTRKWNTGRTIYPRVEDIMMMFLDAIAQREGFVSSSMEQ